MENLYKSDIQKELGQNFINYSFGVNGARAIPDAKTGLKPVATRIMYIMEDEGTNSSKPHRKSAKTVGSVMGRVHPHGDSSIYEALVRLSQSWVMRYCLVDIHGNNGNIAGDGAASMRYTESRLSKLAEDGLLSNLKKKNVDWRPNYSEDEEEPIALPAIFPNLLCNPNEGIGVAMACKWLPHNLREVGQLIISYLNGGALDFKNMAPDFPTGGIIINGKDLEQIYKTGKGRVIIRGKYQIETRAKKTLIVFTEIPYGVNTEPLLEQAGAACDNGSIVGVEEVRDESDKKGLRIIFELTKDASEGKVLQQIFKHTDLQKSTSANQVALVDKTPVLINWQKAIDIYIAHNLDVIVREARYDLAKANARLEIVKGLLRALEDIDNIIALIKKSNSATNAKENLIKVYNFSENQAKAIIDMKLGKLANLEKIELNEEEKALLSTIDKLNSLISNKDAQSQELENRLSLFINKYGDSRRTEVTHIEIKPEEKELVAVVPEPVIVTISETGLIKKVPAAEIKVQKRAGKGIKNKEDATMSIIKTNTVDALMLFSNLGKMYRLVVDNIPTGTMTSKGVPVSTLINLDNGEKIIAATSLYHKSQAKYAIFVTKNGLFKKTFLDEYTKTKRSSGILAVKIKEDDALIKVIFQNDEDVVLITSNGMSIKFETNSVAAVGRVAAGVKSIKLGENDFVVAALPIHKNTDQVAIFTSAGLGKKVELSDFPTQTRGGKGTISYKPTPENGTVIGAEMVSDEDNILICGNYSSLCISAKELPNIGRLGVGNVLIKNNKVLSITKV